MEEVCAHSERYEKEMAGIVEIHFFLGNIAFPFLPDYTAVLFRWSPFYSSTYKLLFREFLSSIS